MDFWSPPSPWRTSRSSAWRTSSGLRWTAKVRARLSRAGVGRAEVDVNGGGAVLEHGGISDVTGEADAAEGPAGRRGEEVAVGRTDVVGRRGATAAAPHVLVD